MLNGNVPDKKPIKNAIKDFTSVMVEYNTIWLLLQFGQTIASPQSSKEWALIDFKSALAFISSLVSTFNFTPPIALLISGSVSIVILSLKKTSIPSASKRPFII